MPRRMTNLILSSGRRLAGLCRAMCRIWLCLSNPVLTMRDLSRGKKAAASCQKGISHLFPTVFSGHISEVVEIKVIRAIKRTSGISSWFFAGYADISPFFMIFQPISQPEGIDFSSVINKTHFYYIPAPQKKKSIKENCRRTTDLGHKFWSCFAITQSLSGIPSGCGFNSKRYRGFSDYLNPRLIAGNLSGCDRSGSIGFYSSRIFKSDSALRFAKNPFSSSTSKGNQRN
jgi:hypothetical protein